MKAFLVKYLSNSCISWGHNLYLSNHLIICLKIENGRNRVAIKWEGKSWVLQIFINFSGLFICLNQHKTGFVCGSSCNVSEQVYVVQCSNQGKLIYLLKHLPFCSENFQNSFDFFLNQQSIIIIWFCTIFKCVSPLIFLSNQGVKKQI
jgi:hypothetical protein